MHEIVEYKLDRLQSGEMIHPPWIDRVTPHTGILYDPATRTFIGFSPIGSERDYKVPDSVKRLTRAELKARAVNLNQGGPPWLFPSTTNPEQGLSPTEIENEVNRICDLYNIL